MRATPAPVSGLDDAVRVSAGNNFTCALRESGAVACWGVNTTGQLGIGTIDPNHSLVPVAVTGLDDAVAVSAVGEHACAVREGGTVVCWGRNFEGNLGTTYDYTVLEYSATPVDVHGVTGAVDVAAQLDHSCALTGAGGVYCWGRGELGQLGTTFAGTSLTPVAALIDDAVAITAGHGFTCTVRDTGDVACWGGNHLGTLGTGAQPDDPDLASNTPVTVLNVSDAVSVAAGQWHACAATASGEVWCWGLASKGQLGDGRPADERPSAVVWRDL
jgi:alpha-tubulin suppressor-like RCC1 family protein